MIFRTEQQQLLKKGVILQQNEKNLNQSINSESFDSSIANVIGGNNDFIDWAPLSTTTQFPSFSDLSPNSTDLANVIDYSVISNSSINSGLFTTPCSSSSFTSNANILKNSVLASNLTRTIPSTSKAIVNSISKTSSQNTFAENGLEMVFEDENTDSKTSSVKSMLQNASTLNNFSSILKQLGDKIIDGEMSANKVSQAASDASLTPPPNTDNNNSGDDETDLKRVRPKRGQYR